VRIAYGGKGLALIGFPCHPFASQDPGNDAWNLTKLLVGKDGRVIKRYAPQDAPEKIAKDIGAALTA
jgi:glutathione peroxidase